MTEDESLNPVWESEVENKLEYSGNVEFGTVCPGDETWTPGVDLEKKVSEDISSNENSVCVDIQALNAGIGDCSLSLLNMFLC